MGSCFSGRIEAERHHHNIGNVSSLSFKDLVFRAVVQKEVSGKDGNAMSMSKCNVLSDIVPPTSQEVEALQPQVLKSFSLSEIRGATRDFHPECCLGEGSFTIVFKGWINKHSFVPATSETGMPVAVKMLKPKGTRGHPEWLTEIRYLGCLQHPNLVKLIGYCLEDNSRFLVYEFVTNGNLGSYLFEKASKIKPLSWELRMRIALSAAKALAFLHNKAQVIHRSFTAYNILLDLNYDVKLADFGLATDEPNDGNKSYVTTRSMYSHGYLAPEYMNIGHSSKKTDIYMFGVVLLQMLCGRRAIDQSRPPNEQNLVEWAMPYLNNRRKMFQVLDANLEGPYSSSTVLKLANLIIMCLSIEPKCRPDIENVVQVMQQIYDSICKEKLGTL